MRVQARAVTDMQVLQLGRRPLTAAEYEATMAKLAELKARL
jgi:hypothetical protein